LSAAIIGGVAIRSEPELRAELAAVLQEVLPSLASERPVREAMDLIVSHVARLASFEFCGVVLPDATGEHVRLSGAYAFPADYAKRLGNLFEELPVADDALRGGRSSCRTSWRTRRSRPGVHWLANTDTARWCRCPFGCAAG
jgi:hypothetical protein